MNKNEKIKDFVRKIVAKSINTYRKSSVRPFRGILYGLYLKYIEPRMIVDRSVVAKRDGIRYKLDLKNSQDNEIYYAGCCEPTVTRIIKKYVKPGMIVFDLGAHTGAHTLRLAKLVGENGKVFAVEPDSQIIQKLKDNIKLNDFKNIIIVNAAFSDTDRADTDRAEKEITLDNYIRINKINKVDFIKIDTEGYEYKIIRGGLHFIKKFTPTMVMEFSRTNLEKCGDSLEDLIELLDSLGYSVFSDKNLKEYSSKKTLLDSMLPETTNNVLCKIKSK